ncbi:MAG: T9SS type A sorting domain-containing protein [Bacteroidota bacterium]|nr:T9SS type A sorting domain-containing protein [Bacteroidota bacterium]
MTILKHANVHRPLLLLLAISFAFAGQPFEKSKTDRFGLQKVHTNDVFTAMTINNIFSYYSNNGDGSLNPFTGDGGFELISSNRGISFFEEGLVWAGKHLKDSQIKAGGSTYNHGLQAGKIITPGTTTTNPVAEDAGLAKNRIYKVRPDVGPNTPLDADLSAKLKSEDVTLLGKYETYTVQEIYDKYVSDWNNWPAADGAPYTDKNHDGKYDPKVDVPGVPGADQTIWYVANDLDASRTYYLAGANPIGIEFQRTIWAYRRSGALGNTVFEKNILINKSGYNIDSMYVSQWADPDLGGSLGYTDDFTGCDTVLSLGYIYNGKAVDGFYGPKPPASGFDFFQGPLVPGLASDSGKTGGQYVHGKKNLGMTAFNFFINSNSTYADPRLNDPRGTTEWYNLMKGLVGRTGAAYVNPTTGQTTRYVMSGDPVKNKGWIEGQIAPPGDRRMALCSGPFTMANGDTQEIVVAGIVGQGSNRLSSISVLKFYDQIAQAAYDNNFDLPSPPPAPVVSVAELPNQIVLNWGDPTTAAATENNVSKGYSMEGYNVYQLPSAGFNNAKLLATYDKVDGILNILDDVYDDQVGTVVNKPVQFGNDYGISRYYPITKDNITDLPLVNGQTYYFAVTAYNYNPTPGIIPASLESSPTVLAIVPQSLLPGQRTPSKYGDTVKVTHTGTSDGKVTPLIVDPKALTGSTYEVSFDTTGGSTTWTLTNKTTNKVVLTNQANQAGDNNYFVTDGMQVLVAGPAPGMKGYSVKGTRQWTWVGGNWGAEGFNGAIGNGFDQWFSSSTVTYDKLKNVEIRFANTDNQGTILDVNDPNASFAYRYLRGATAAAAHPSFVPFIINKTAGYAFQDYNKSMPFAAYDIEANPPRRLMVGYLENNSAGGLVDGHYWPPYNTTDNIAAAGPREWFYIFDKNYSATPDPTLETDILNNTVPIMWFGTITRRDTNAWSSANTFTIDANHINTPADKFSFTSTAVTYTAAAAKEDIGKVNVFPNPYFGFNLKEPNKYTKFVTFNHLPQKATLSIINLAGVRVRKITKDDPSQFLNWDLKNEAGLPVASGMYVVYIDLGSLGTKILKLAVVQELQQLDKY